MLGLSEVHCDIGERILSLGAGRKLRRLEDMPLRSPYRVLDELYKQRASARPQPRTIRVVAGELFDCSSARWKNSDSLVYFGTI